jgi:hypothetical protein
MTRKTLSCLWLLLIFGYQAIALANNEPLLMEGKKTLYQRVLTRPAARVYKNAGDKNGIQKPAFTRYYVYQRKQHLNQEWLEVGLDSRGKTIGWMLAEKTVPWKQQLSLAFTHTAGRERVLFFKHSEDLEAILTAQNPKNEIAPIRKKIAAGSNDSRIISIEPEKPIDINKNFYLLPILNSKEVYTEIGEQIMLEVASVSLNENETTDPSILTDKSDTALLLKRFKAAVVFVIDSTISMGPYIDRTRNAIKRIYGQIEEAQLLDKVKFGLVAYRSSIEAVPGLEYIAREYVDPVDVKDGKDFLQKVSALKAAGVSSRLFNEDTYAGVMYALNHVEWTEFGARYIVLITDAGAIEGDHTLSSTGFSAEQVREEAKYRGVAIYTLHLKTPQGKKNHQQAEAQYKALSSTPLLRKSLYYPIDTGSVDEFSNIVDSLSDSVVNLVNDAFEGKFVAGSAKSADVKFGEGNSKSAKSSSDKIREDMISMGYAMQLSYLGSQTGVQAPPVFKAWISEAAIEDLTIKATEVRVLLTKNQLSDMYQVVKSITDEVLEGIIKPNDFFTNLRSLAATLGRDPNQINQSKSAKLHELNLMGEYLDDLPYKSFILNLDEETWIQLADHQQDTILRELEYKLKHYQLYNDDTDRWIPLAENSDPADYVYPVPIGLMP